MKRLISDNNTLNMEVFKELFTSIGWNKLPRTLGVNHTEFFYVGKLEDSERRINITVRPTRIMAVTESLKGRMPQNGELPPGSYNGPLVEWGYYCEVKVPEQFIKDVDEWATLLPANTTQELTW